MHSLNFHNKTTGLLITSILLDDDSFKILKDQVKFPSGNPGPTYNNAKLNYMLVSLNEIDENKLSVFDSIQAVGYTAGYSKGQSVGYDEGYYNGKLDGYDSGYIDGNYDSLKGTDY